MSADIPASLAKAQALIRNGQLKNAERIYLRLHQEQPRNADVVGALVTYYNRFALQFGNAAKAAQLLIRLVPKHWRAHLLAAEAFSNAGQTEQALKSVEIARLAQPSDPDVLFVAASVAMRAGQYQQAKKDIAAALGKRPDHWPTRLQNARLLLATGALSDARGVARKLWQDKPDDLNALEILATVETLDQRDPARHHLEDVVLPELKPKGGPLYSKALAILGKIQRDSGAFEASFDSFTESKKARPIQRDEAGSAAFVDALVKGISASQFAKTRGSQSEQPLLIVGMPRCGSTLLEQILSQHTKVSSAGESRALLQLTRDLSIPQHDAAAMCFAINEINKDRAQALAEQYLSHVQATNTRASGCIIDKALHNFELLGLMAVVLPGARIIDMRRDPMDTCVSCYTQPLSAWHNYTQDIALLGRTYLQYDRLMNHWADVLPHPVLRVHYEDLVANPEQETRRILSFVGLDWDADCLDFAQSENPVQTLSAAQVRQPLHAKAIQGWKRYGDRIDPLKRELASLYPHGFDARAVLRPLPES